MKRAAVERMNIDRIIINDGGYLIINVWLLIFL